MTEVWEHVHDGDAMNKKHCDDRLRAIKSEMQDMRRRLRYIHDNKG